VFLKCHNNKYDLAPPPACLHISTTLSSSPSRPPLPSLLQPQYIFLHDALLEAIECGVTEVAVRDLRDQYRRLGIIDDPKGKTDLQIEFEKLDTTIHRKIHRNTASLPVNKLMKRYANRDCWPLN